MNKQMVQIIGLSLATGLLLTATASAETSTHTDVSVESHTSGGLGTGLNSMVRTILGEDQQHSDDAGRAAPQAPAATMMMEAQSAANTTMMAPAPAPQALKASLRSAVVADTFAAPEPMTEEELHTYITDLLASDSNIQSIDTSETHVRVTYAVPAKIFKFVRVTMRVTAGAYVSGKTDVTYPWYAFPTKRASAEFRRSLAERVEPLITTDAFSNEEQKALIDELHFALAAKFSSSTRGDQ